MSRLLRPLLGCFSALFILLSALICEATETSSRDTVLAGSEIGYPPFCTVDEDGVADGFAVELLRASLAAMGRDVRYETGPWQEVKQSLIDGRVQALPLVGRTPEREAFFDFTFPYLTLHGTIVVRDDEHRIRSLADLAGKQIAVMRSDNAEEFVRRMNLGAKIVPVETFGEALRELSAGEHDAVVIQKLLALQLMRALDLDNLQTVGPPLEEFTQSFCFAVRKGDQDLLAVLNEGLALVMNDGTFRRLWHKWIAPLATVDYQERRIVVGGDEAYPPYEYLDENGRPAGYNVDLTRAIARELGLNVTIRLGPWNEIRGGLSSGEIDLVQGMFYSAEREKDYRFSQPHTRISHVAVTTRGYSLPATLDDLAGHSLAVMAEDITHDLVRKHGVKLAELVTTGSQEEALRLVAEGEVDFALAAKLPALYWQDKHQWQTLEVGNKALLAPEYAYATAHNQEDLLALFAEGLSALKASGEYHRIYARHLGVYEPADSKIVQLLLAVAGFLAVALFFGFFWSRSLKAEVHKQTVHLEREVQARQTAVEALMTSEENFRRVFDDSAIGMAKCDLQGHIILVNDAFVQITGYPAEDLRAHSIKEITLPQYREKEQQLLNELLTGEIDHFHFEQQYHHSEGHSLWVRLNVSLIHDQEQQPQYLLWQVENIDQKKRMALALEEREKMVNLLLNSTAEGIYGVDSRGYCIFCNRSAEFMLGYPEKQLLGQRLHDLLACRSPGREHCIVDEVILNGRPEHVEDGSLCHAKKGRFPAEYWVHPMVEGDRVVGAVVAFVDITEKKKMREQQLRSSQLAALGELAAGMAHEINNPINGIINYADLLSQTAATERDQQILGRIVKEGHRIATIVKNLLNFSRPGWNENDLIDVIKIIEEPLQLLGKQLEHDSIKIILDVPDDLPNVYGNIVRLEQVILNLLTNARHALNDKFPGPHPEKILQISVDAIRPKESPYLQISFRDQGCGISAKNLDKIFNPFYTTKKTGFGTGLGLSICHEIVLDHGGELEVESEEGVYTKISIKIPAQAVPSNDQSELVVQA